MFRHTAQAQQSQAQQSQKTPDCCCFNVLPCFARKAVIDNQQQPEPPFIKDQERLMKDLEYKVGHMGKGKGTTSFFGSVGMGKNGGLFSGGSSGGGLFSTAVLSQDALDALHSGGSP